MNHAEAEIALRQPLLALVILILLGWYIVSPSTAIAICLGVSAGLFLSAAVWARELALKVEGQRQLEYAAMQVGDELGEIISLSNRSLLPAFWTEFIDRSSLPGYTVSGVRAADGHENIHWRAHTICARRGVFSLGPWELKTGDPFGLFLVRQVYTQPQQILVYPPLAALPAEMLPHHGTQGEMRPLNQPLAAETSDGMSVRPYIPGDPLHKIHWRTTARRSAPFVKIFEPEAASRIWIVPDMDESVQRDAEDETTDEMVILLSASLAARLLQDKLAVGLYSGGPEASIILPQRGQTHLWAMLERLAPLQKGPSYNLAATLEQLRPLLSLRDLLVVITPSLDGRWVSALERMAQSRAGKMAEVILIDPASYREDIPLGAAETLVKSLAEQGFQARLVRRGDIQPLKAAYGILSRWEFSISATGKAIARQSPRRAAEIFAGQARRDEVRP